MTNWKICTIGDLGMVIGGATPSTKAAENYDGGTIAWITPKDLAGFSGRFISYGERNITKQGLKSCSTKLMPKHTVLFSSRAPIGYIAIANRELCTNQGFKSVVPNDDTDYKFLYYLLKYNKNKIENLGSGTTFKEVSGSTMRGIKVSVPASIEEQRKIASILSLLDDKIEKNTEINKNLEQQIQELYKEWFITNREANWQRIPLSDIIFFQEGPGIRNWQYVEDGVKFINIRCINNGLIDTSTANKISLEEASGKYSHFMLEPYDIVMSCSGTLGRYAIVLPQNLPLCLNTSVIRFRPKQYKDDYSFVYGYMTSKEFLNQQITMANGSAQVNFGPTHLKKIEIVEPPVETRKKFNDLVFPLIETQISLRAENTRLVEIRDTLLPCLMSGEIDVSEVEI
ncbi:restriction endonuclease subunit S [Lactobacillus iners]|uniref:restriction endonuclease subunit S n=1 Tax=Lactobacillus iners TaxID=147802 RepID=UPI0022CDF3FC|nr:restriction endonuclease subunit S [Lactobacillus iners]MCZ9655274.1 restriction endonuclease subunit S [Lactobacillus iners]